MLERNVERVFSQRVRSLGGVTYKIAPTHAGLPDRMVILPGHPIYLVELKADDGRVDPAQAVLFSRLARLGTHVIIVRGATEAREFTPPPLPLHRMSLRAGGPPP